MKKFKITALLFFLCVLFSCDKADLLRNNPLDPKSTNAAPLLTTAAATNIDTRTATLGGTITSQGSSAVKARGVCWSTNIDPTISSSKTSDGTGTGTFVSNISGLTPNTKYFVRAYATNNGGTGYGSSVTISTLAETPTPVVSTNTVTPIGVTTALGGGNVTSAGTASVTAKGVCWSTVINPTIALTTKTNEGSGTGTYTSNLTGLTAGTFYHVRAYATNANGTSYGSDVTFTTLTTAAIPTLTTSTPTGIAMTTATGGGVITFDGGASVTDRGVCWGTTLNPTTALTTKTSDGTGTGTFTSNITGMTGGTIYHIRAYAINSAGTAYGSDLTFTTGTTASISTVTTTTVGSITSTTAIGGGNVTSDGGAAVTARGVCWSLTTGPTIAISTKTSDGSGIGIFTSNITGLTLNTKYYVRAYATNSVGTAYGPEVSFTTSAVTILAPTVSTTAASAVTISTATSGGNVTSDGGGTVTARGVCWSTTLNPDTARTTKTSDGTGTGIFSSSLVSLNPSTTYHIRAYATNAAGTSYGTDMTFTTLAANIPTITTTPNITLNAGTTATSGGNITSDGGAPITAKGVCWGLSLNPSITDSKTTNGTGSGIFVSNLTGLISGTNYHLRAYATNTAGTAYGQDIAFTAASLSTLTTSAITGITQTTATGGGNITLDGGSPVTAYGICWSTSTNPTVALTTKTSDGTGTGTFYSYLTGLTASTTYYIRAYATNAVGTAYGTSVTFTTSAPVIPTLTTVDLSAVTLNTATSGGNITADGFATITAKGVVWGSVTGPTVALGTKTIDATGGTGAFISNITGLAANSVYFVRAYATNITGTTYGNEFILKTATGTMTDNDGNTYYTVTIGTQVWMRDNLKTTKYRDGNFIPNITDNTWSTQTTGAYCWYNNDVTNKATYGALYNFYTITDSRVLCPTSWHVPTDAEWTTMTTLLGGTSAYDLKETGTAHWLYSYGSETNKTGFTALPGGFQNNNIGYYGYWWSATETSVSAATDYYMDYYSSGVVKSALAKTNGMSVRCIHD
jgi:uncharacterized protein (TIGR02145 family)